MNATALRSADGPDTIVLVETWPDRNKLMSEQLKRPIASSTRHIYRKFCALLACCCFMSQSEACRSEGGPRQAVAQIGPSVGLANR